MGDRGNIFIQEAVEDGKRVGVWLYSHWGGYNMPLKLQVALQRQQRWEDHSYFARIVFDTMTKGHAGEETGFGISARITDNEYPVLVANCAEKKVELFAKPDWKARGEVLKGEPIASWTFGQYIELSLEGDPWAALDIKR